MNCHAPPRGVTLFYFIRGNEGMSILQEVLKWGKDLAPWQSDAVARLFSKQILTPADLDDLYALLKSEHGIPDPEGRKPNPLDDSKIPAGSQSGTLVELVAVKNMINCNAIAENQTLKFGEKGITVIYGDNGSGKSGYSRVLKKACRARDQSEPILPNATIPYSGSKPAQATFEILVNGSAHEVAWNSEMAPPEELSTLAIFDSRCARAYLDDEDDFSYVPYGLDILEGLAHVCRQLDARIRSEKSQCLVDTSVFHELVESQTAAGKLVKELSDKTVVAKVEALATLSSDELDRRNALEKSLKADNPLEQARKLRLQAARINKLASNAEEKLKIVNAEAAKKLNELAEAYHATKAAAELAAKEFKEDTSLLPGTGGEEWKELFEAARRFSQLAYPDRKFPQLGEESPCPLCQQPLDAGQSRLVQFDEFIQQDAEKKMRACRQALIKEYQVFEKEDLSIGFDDILYKEIEALDEPLPKNIRAFEKELVERHGAIKTACKDRNWDKLKPLPESPSASLQSLASKLNDDAEGLENAADEKKRASLQQEFDELDARLKLSKLKQAVLSAIEKYSLSAKLDKCLSAVKTNSITMKSTELTEKIVSKELAHALNTEFKGLKAGNLHVALDSRSAKGKTLHKLKLELPQSRNPLEILSEGEQRAIAIGSFLAEVNIGGGSGGIIFDDPVSSLDHKRRERVAARLVFEATKRQVIILTHDVYFLCVLMEEADRNGVPITTQSLSKRPEGFGVADPKLPFETMNTKSRIGALRSTHPQIAKLHKDGDEIEYRKQVADCYWNLRIAWERAVEEVLFQNVVLRFRKGISTQPLVRVEVEDSDFEAIEQAMTKCSNYAHDQALMGGVDVPEPDEVLADINALDAWRLSVIERANNVEKRRKGAAK